MHSAILAAVLAFVVLFAAMTIDVAVRTGFDVLTGAALVILALIGIGVVGALVHSPPDE
jgi:hypothetical protein